MCIILLPWNVPLYFFLAPVIADTEDVCIVERLFSSSLVAIVSLKAPRKLKVCHFKKGTEICNYSYSNTILAVKLNRQVSRGFFPVWKCGRRVVDLILALLLLIDVSPFSDRIAVWNLVVVFPSVASQYLYLVKYFWFFVYLFTWGNTLSQLGMLWVGGWTRDLLRSLPVWIILSSWMWKCVRLTFSLQAKI